MTLPTSRNTTYAVGTEIKSADLNDLQDHIIGGKHGSIIRTAGVNPDVVSGSAAFVEDGYSTGSYIGLFTLPMQIGEKLTALTVYLKDGNPGVAYQLKLIDMTDGSSATKSDLMTSDASGTDQVIVATGIVVAAAVVTSRYFLGVNTSTAGARIYGIEYSVEHA